MTDRELLELAAKAAGIVGFYRDGDFPGIVEPVIGGGDVPWNPLVNDGQALRLAVQLGVELTIGHWENRTVSAHRTTFRQEFGLEWPESVRASENLAAGPEAATRRAIVRVAAEIGKAMNATSATHP